MKQIATGGKVIQSVEIIRTAQDTTTKKVFSRFDGIAP